MNVLQADLLIIGAGIIGLTIAKEFKDQFPNKQVIIIDNII